MSKIEDPGLKDRIYCHVRDKILTLEIKPGEKIPELSIAQELGVSRPLVREAVRHLSWDGLIKLEPNRAATVAVMDAQMIQNLAFVRWQHDQLAIPLAVYNGSPRDFDALRAVALRCLEANAAGDLSARHTLDAQFHQQVYQLTGNQLLYDLHCRLGMLVRLWQALHITSPAMLAEGLQQHLELVDRFEARDIPGALQVIQAHSTHSFGSDFQGKLLTPQDLLQLQ
ncbi:MAG: GntR family transcriptional regulator [Lawsonibacter sp.]